MVDKNDLFGYISAPYLPINAKFGSEMKNHVQIYVTSPKRTFPKLKMAVGRHFQNSWNTTMSAENYPISIKFVMQMKIFIPDAHFTNKMIFQIQDGGRTPY